MGIGPRTIKTGVAVALTLYISYALAIRSPFYAVVAAIIVIQPTVSDSWKTGFFRMLGTFVGAVVGAVFVSISPGNPLLAAIGIIIIILLMNKFNWRESIVIAGVVFIGIFLDAEGDYLSYSIHRLLDTSLGIIIAVFINYAIYPPRYNDKIVDETKQISKNILKYNLRSLQMLLREKEEDMDLLQEQIHEIEEDLSISDKFLSLQKKQEKLQLQKDVSYKEMLMKVNLEKETFQHLRNMQNVLQKGIAIEVVDLIREDIHRVKDALEELNDKKKELCEIYGHEDKKPISLNYIVEDIKKAKMRLKNNEKIDDYSTDEVVKMLVFLYNLEEALLKFNIIISC